MQKVIDFLKSISSPNLAAIRHALTVLFTVLGMVGLISVAGTSKNIDQLMTAIQAFGVFAGALAAFLGVVGPIINGWIAGWSAQDTQQIKRVEAIANSDKPVSTEAKVALLDATASLPEVTKPIPVPEALAKATDSPLIVPVKGS